MSSKIRLDDLLIQRGLAEDRRHALALIMRGAVRVDGEPARKAGEWIDPTAELQLHGLPRFVSRGGLKLEAALKTFKIDVMDRLCIDLGASTGGFTDCLLQHGARRVYAFDVGRGQLDWNLRNDSRVVVREGVNVRHLVASDVGEQVDLVVADLAFISLKLILPVLKAFSGAQAVLLVKPQFEARPDEVGRGGIVHGARKREEIVSRIRDFAEELGFEVRGSMLSPVVGQKGNREYFLWLVL
jgi:23S rRNA (cytidine1920-2'-O)/16S rRNA (cytidine1409-2'-O)-methyltransferase